jgi:glycine/D-amino acid oxidase-like deaminating enzyme
MSVSPQEIAVVGCGIVGLSAAITAQRAGAKAIIYTREMLHRTRSVRAQFRCTVRPFINRLLLFCR